MKTDSTNPVLESSKFIYEHCKDVKISQENVIKTAQIVRNHKNKQKTHLSST